MTQTYTYRLRIVLCTLLVVFGLLAFFASGFINSLAPVATAAPNTFLNFQARLKNSSGSVVPDGNYNIEFKLYNVDSAGTALWTETRTGSSRVRVANGYFTVSLGSVTGFPSTIEWGEEHWVTMNIGGTGSPSWDGEMNPRLRLTAVPHAFKADVANALSDGTSTFTANDFIKIAPGTSQDVSSSNAALRLNQTGVGSLLQLQSGGVDMVTVSNDGDLAVSGAATFTGILTASSGAALSGGAISLNDSSNFVTNINTGTSTGAVNIGNATAGLITLQSGSGIYMNNSINASTNINTGTSTGSITVGNSNAGAITLQTSSSVNIGISDTIGTLLVLDTKTDAGDPTGTNGAMYYNSSLGKFRCYEGGVWVDCISGLSASLTDNTANAWDIQEGTNDYFNINTTNGSESMSFGNATTNPSYNFQGSGLTTFEGGITQTSGARPVYVGSITNGTTLNGLKRLNVTGNYLYATAMNGDGLTIVDITNPTAPTIVGRVTDSANLDRLRDVQVVGNYAYAISMEYNGNTSDGAFSVIDISSKTNPTVVSTINSPTYFNSVRGLWISGQYAYTVAEDSDAMTVIDISNPASPTIVGTLVDNGTRNLDYPNDIIVKGKYAYITSLNEDALTIVDISNPTAPTVAGTVSNSTTLNGAHSVFIRDRYAYIAAANYNGLTIVDISNPASPSIVGTVADATNFVYPHGVVVAGDYAYAIGATSNSFVAIDISNPTTPVITSTRVDATNHLAPADLVVKGQYAYVSATDSDSIAIYYLGGAKLSVAEIGTVSTTILNVQSLSNIAALVVGDSLNVGYGGIQTSGRLSVSNAVTFTNEVDSVGAFRVYGASGGASVLGVDTLNGRVGIGTDTPSTKLEIAGSTSITGSIQNTSNLYIGATNSSSSSSQTGINNQSRFQPQGTTTGVFGFNNILTVESSSRSVNITAGYMKLDTAATYTGTISVATGLQIAAPTINGSNKFNNYWGIQIADPSTNGGTSGNMTNVGLRVEAFTAGAGSGGFVENHGIRIGVPSGSGAGTTNNRGLFITGGSAATRNYAIYSDSAAKSYFSGSVGIGTTTPASLLSVGSAGQFQVNGSGDVQTSGTLAVGGQVTIGTSDTVGTLLVLDTKTNAGDPTGVAGGMYYNSATSRFRCYQGSAWKDCSSGMVYANTSVPAGNTVANTTAETNFASNYSIPANDCQPGRVYRVSARGTYNTPGAAGNATVKLKLGTTAIYTIPTGGWIPSSSVNYGWETNFLITCATAGASGAVEAQGSGNFDAVPSQYVANGNTSTITVDTTTAQTLQMSFQWGTSSSTRSITLRQFIVEAL